MSRTFSAWRVWWVMSAVVLAMVSAVSAVALAATTFMAQLAAKAKAMAKEEWAAVEKAVELEGRAWQILLVTS